MRRLVSIFISLLFVFISIMSLPTSAMAESMYNNEIFVYQNPEQIGKEDEEGIDSDSSDGMAKKGWKERAAEAAGKAGEKLESVKQSAGSVMDTAQDKAGEIKNSISQKASDTADVVREKKDEIVEKAAKTGRDVAEYSANKANEIKENVVDGVQSLSARMETLVSSFDKSAFERGWNITADYIGTGISTLQAKEYINSVEEALQATRKNIIDVASKNGEVASRAGFVAEEWHTGTFNASAKAAGAKEVAEALHENGLGSVDVVVKTASGGEVEKTYGLKYYKDAKSTAEAQSKRVIEAQHVMQKYADEVNERKAKGIAIRTKEEFLDEYAKNNDIDNLYASLYEGQGKVVPFDQKDDILEYLQKKIETEKSRNRTASTQIVEGLEETTDTITATIKNEDGSISSLQLTRGEARGIVDNVREGKCSFEDLGLRASDFIKPSYIANQAIQGGAQSAIIDTALVMGPEIYQMIRQYMKDGTFDQQQLRDTGLDALVEGSKGFIEGSVSTAIFECCNLGMFGPAFTNVNPSVVGALTVLTVDAAVYSYQLNAGQITSEEYADMLAEEIFVTAVSLGTGALVQILLPMIPGAYFAGSIAGSMLASTGYAYGKEIVLAAINSGGLDMIIPVKADEKTIIANNYLSFDLKDILAPFKGIKVKDADSIKISMLNFLQSDKKE